MISRRTFLTASGSVAGLATLAPGDALAQDVSPVANDARPSRADGVYTGGSRSIELVEGHKIWVKQIGNGDIPVLTLHGGPGFAHYYLECLEDFIPRDRIRYWFYDQLGCGFSDRPDDPSLWTLERFREEVEQVRVALNLDRFVLYGQSWGGLLAMEYALAYPQRLSRLVISNMTAGVAAYVKHADVLLNRLPPKIRDAMKSYETRKDYQNPAYRDLLMKYLYSKYLCRLDPWPEPVLRSLKDMNEQVYNTMQGPSEFTIIGNLKNWSRWNDLHRIETPTLLIVGRHDTMSVEDIQRMGRLIPNSKVVICENGSHLALYDDQTAYFNALVPFLLQAA